MKYVTEDGEIKDTICEDCPTIYFKTPFNHNTTEDAKDGALICKDPSLTDQSFQADADINTIMDRIQSGNYPPIEPPAHYGDDNRMNLFEARMRIAESNAAFYKLPPETRFKYQNDPARWEQATLHAYQTGDVELLRESGIDIAKRAQTPQEGSSPGTPGAGTGGGAPTPEPPQGPTGAK